MNGEVLVTAASPLSPRAGSLPVPWRDPHSIPQAELAGAIQRLEQECIENPASAGLRTCLGMAYAMNFEVYKAMDTLEAASAIDPGHFYSQLKKAELYYRLRALPRAEAETQKALELATDGREILLARRQLQEIRRLIREGTQKPAWTKPLTAPAVALGALAGLGCLIMTLWR